MVKHIAENPKMDIKKKKKTGLWSHSCNDWTALVLREDLDLPAGMDLPHLQQIALYRFLKPKHFKFFF